MALVLPKIVYPTAGTTLNFLYQPPRKVPYKSYAGIRRDLISSAGVLERIFNRRDEFLKFEMEYVKNDGSYMQAWDAFIKWALQNTAFDYYPDGTSGTHSAYILEDTNWEPQFKQLGIFTWHMVFRLSVGWP